MSATQWYGKVRKILRGEALSRTVGSGIPCLHHSSLNFAPKQHVLLAQRLQVSIPTFTATIQIIRHPIESRKISLDDIGPRYGRSSDRRQLCSYNEISRAEIIDYLIPQWKCPNNTYCITINQKRLLRRNGSEIPCLHYPSIEIAPESAFHAVTFKI